MLKGCSTAPLLCPVYTHNFFARIIVQLNNSAPSLVFTPLMYRLPSSLHHAGLVCVRWKLLCHVLGFRSANPRVLAAASLWTISSLFLFRRPQGLGSPLGSAAIPCCAWSCWSSVSLQTCYNSMCEHAAVGFLPKTVRSFKSCFIFSVGSFENYHHVQGMEIIFFMCHPFLRWGLWMEMGICCQSKGWGWNSWVQITGKLFLNSLRLLHCIHVWKRTK